MYGTVALHQCKQWLVEVRQTLLLGSQGFQISPVRPLFAKIWSNSTLWTTVVYNVLSWHTENMSPFLVRETTCRKLYGATQPSLHGSTSLEG